MFVGPMDKKSIFEIIKCSMRNYDMKITILISQQTSNAGPPLMESSAFRLKSDVS